MAQFRTGQIVHHKRYDYRGVIVAFDATCQADDAWYNKNRTQPTRDQPWYHVLVDDAEHMTYVAERHLETDESRAPIRHPWLTEFFSDFEAGRYIPQQTVN